jgi:hypothetical protein
MTVLTGGIVLGGPRSNSSGVRRSLSAEGPLGLREPPFDDALPAPPDVNERRRMNTLRTQRADVGLVRSREFRRAPQATEDCLSSKHMPRVRPRPCQRMINRRW